jgi:hypothetical protein
MTPVIVSEATSATRAPLIHKAANFFSRFPSEEEKKIFIQQQFDRALSNVEARRIRLFDNLSYYMGQQIRDDARRKAADEGRKLWTYNIGKRKIDGLAGSLLQENFNITYMPLDGKNTTLVMALEDMLEADKNLNNWDAHFASFVLFGLIEEAVMELTTTTKNSPLGNLCFECTQPGCVVVDPNWRTGNSADMEEVYKYGYYSPTQIISMFPDMEDQILEQLELKRKQGRDYSDANRNQNFAYDYQDQLSGDYQVIQYANLDPEHHTREIDVATGLELPDTTDTSYKRDWCQINGVNPEYVRQIKSERKTCFVSTIIPGLLPTCVESRRHELQIGRLPFFPWSAARINGQTRGEMNDIKGIQDELNKRENMLTNIIENSANGSALLDEALVDGDDTLKQLIQDNWTNPQFKAWVKAGTLSSGKNFIAQLPRTSPPTDAFNQINHLWDGIDRVLPVNAASDGRSEGKQESGILYQQKTQAIIVAQTILKTGLSSVSTEMGEAYFLAAKTYYSDVTRVFVKPDGSKFSINEIIELPTGELGIRNDVSSLQNIKTLVKMGQDSPSSRFTRRLVAIDMLKEIPQNMPKFRAVWFKELSRTLDLSDEFKDEVMNALNEESQVADANLDNQLHTNLANSAKAKAVEQNPTGQQPQQAGGQPAGGQPAQAQQQAQKKPSGAQALQAALAPLMKKAA